MPSRPERALNKQKSKDTQKSNAAPDLLDETRRVWQPQTDRVLTREDAREIVENIVGFFDILHEWDKAERRRGRGRPKR
jgi:hypothetical protein